MSRIQEVRRLTILNKNYKKENGKKPHAPKSFIPPTLEEVKKYIKANADLGNVDPEDFWKYFNDGEWIDSKGNRVRNWKQKLRTWSNHERKGIQKTERAASAATKEIGKRASISSQDFRELQDPLE